MASDELTTYACTVCGAGHSNPKTIAVCTNCGKAGTVKVRPAFMVDQPRTRNPRCDVCGGDHPTRDEDGTVCRNLPEGGAFSAPSDARQAGRA